MNERRDIAGDVEPGIEPAELSALQATADRLADERPVPAAGYRAALRRALLERAWEPGPAPPRALIASYAGSGLALMLVAAAGLAGIGPFAN